MEKQVRILVVGQSPKTLPAPVAGETVESFQARLDAAGIQTTRVESFLVNGVPVDDVRGLLAALTTDGGGLVVASPKIEGGC